MNNSKLKNNRINRLYLDCDLKINDLIKIEGQDFIYINNVLRHKIEDKVSLFNGVDGEFLSQIENINKKNLTLKIIERTSVFKKPSNITLAFSIIKGKNLEFIAEKATELGVSKFQPLITDHSITDNFNETRFFANVKEASEQSKRVDIPEIISPKKIRNWLQELDFTNKIIIFCNESGGVSFKEIANKNKDYNFNEIIIIIGPEGGFSDSEFTLINGIKQIHQISLGSQILRSETAVIASIVLAKEFLTINQ